MLKGTKHLESTKIKMSLASKGREKPNIQGSKHYLWKGDEVSYLGMHGWVARRLGKARICEYADNSCKGRFEWSNKSQQYKRDLDDWQQLCISHHRRYDGIKPTKLLKGRILTEEHKRKISEGVRRRFA